MSDVSSKVWVFFYGAFMSPDALAEHGVIVDSVLPARLTGFELSVRPRVNLTRSDLSSAYGALVAVTHEDLAGIYAGLRESFGLIYRPEAVLAETLDGRLRPALCYFTQGTDGSVADAGYVKRLAGTQLEEQVNLEDYSVSNRGLRSGLIGSPERVAERIAEFEDAGVDLLLLQCSPQLEEMERFAETVIRRADSFAGLHHLDS